MRIKVAIIIEAAVGGTRTHIVDVLTFLPRDKFDITFIYSTHRADPAFADNLAELGMLGIRLIELPMQKSITSIANLRSIMTLRKLIRKERFDVIHLHSAIAGFVGRVAVMSANSNARLYYSPHGGSFHMMGKGLKGKFFKLVERALTLKRLTIVAVSAAEKNTIQAMLRINPGRITVIYNGLRKNKSERPLTVNRELIFERAALKIPEGSFVVLYPAVFLPAKGHAHFLECLGQTGLAGNIRILLAGHGPEEELIRKMISDLGLSDAISIIGFRTDLPDWFRASDLVILPSKGEVFGYVILEAFREQKAVFATRVGGIPELIEDGKDGLMFGYEDIRGMITAINGYSEKKEELTGMGLNGAAKAASLFSADMMVSKLTALYGGGKEH